MSSTHASTAEPTLPGYFEGFAFAKINGTLYYKAFATFETRNPSTFQLIFKGLARYELPDFDWMLVNTADRDDFDWMMAMVDGERRLTGSDGRRYKFFSCNYSTEATRADAGPDFAYDHWKQTGLDDYEQTCARVAQLGPAQTNMLGWRGANTHPSRIPLVALDEKAIFDTEFIVWDRTNPNKLQASNFLSFEEQVARWRFLIDVEGNGYSARLKLLLRCPRVVFIQDRPYKEDFFPHLVPWQHYVPVKNDFSDLKENMLILLKDPALERLIIESARDFAQTYLTRQAAEVRWAHKIKTYLMFGRPAYV